VGEAAEEGGRAAGVLCDAGGGLDEEARKGDEQVLLVKVGLVWLGVRLL